MAAVLGRLNLSKVKNLRLTVAEAVTARETTEQSRVKNENDLKAREAAIAETQAKLAERDGRMVASKEQLAQILDEKKQLEARLQDKDSEIATLQKQVEQKQPGSVNPGAPSTIELQAQLDDARQQLDSAEREKGLLSEKMEAIKERSSQLEDEKKRRAMVRGKVGVRGTILAVNQAYNFVVLDLGGRNGVEAHSEMLILRDGTYIGKIRISSVEPATAIGDIITSTLARGVQVQKGDIVIYAGSNS
jgi:chromosome segregation ATPase